MSLDPDYEDYDCTKTFADMVGKTITNIRISENFLVFSTAEKIPAFSFVVYGDCCSHSYFSEVYGAEKLVGPIVKVEWDHANEALSSPDEKKDGDCVVAVYGFKIISDHPVFGEVTTVIGFRNSSNGYYGGEMLPIDGKLSREQQKAMVVVTDHWSAF